MSRGKEVNDIYEFKRQGLSISQISTLMSYSRPTIRKYLAHNTTPRYGPRQPRATRLTPYHAFLR